MELPLSFLLLCNYRFTGSCKDRTEKSYVFFTPFPHQHNIKTRKLTLVQCVYSCMPYYQICGFMQQPLQSGCRAILGTSLAVQWLRCWTSTAGGMCSIPGQGTKIPHALQPEKEKKNKKHKIWSYSIITSPLMFSLLKSHYFFSFLSTTISNP